jgi:hypothetical protein
MKHSKQYISTRRHLVRSELFRGSKTRCRFGFPAWLLPLVTDLIQGCVEADHPVNITEPSALVIHQLNQFGQAAKLVGYNYHSVIDGGSFSQVLWIESTIAEAFAFYSHLAIGSRLAGGSRFWIGAQACNYFARFIELSFPNMAEMLVESLSDENDVAVPTHLRKDGDEHNH